MSKQRSGQITVTTAGTAVQGTDAPLAGGTTVNKQVLVYVRALPGNTGVMYMGQDGADDVTSSNGYPLSAGDQLPVYVQNLNELWFDASVSGEGVAWFLAG
jgi:hypothetical protein